MANEHIISVNEADFEFKVIQYSKQVPVVVDFWAPWCGPCKEISPVLAELAEKASGSFRLAKVNVDESPNLALRYSVRSIPTVKAFRDAHVISEFTGAIPPAQIRDFVRALAPSQHDLVLEKGLGLLDMQNWAGAEENLQKFLGKFPANPEALLGLARSLLGQGYINEAREILVNFPASKEYNTAEILIKLVKPLERVKSQTTLPDDPLEAAYVHALHLVLHGKFEAAMDGMLDILRQDKHFHSDEARRVMVGLFELLGQDSPLTRQYRNELAMVLF